MADTTGTTTVHTVEVVRYDDPVIITEQVPVAAFIAGYTDPTRGAMRWICGSLPVVDVVVVLPVLPARRHPR